MGFYNNVEHSPSFLSVLFRFSMKKQKQNASLLDPHTPANGGNFPAVRIVELEIKRPHTVGIHCWDQCFSDSFSIVKPTDAG